MRASDVLRLPPFTRVIPCADFYVGVLKVGHRSVLCIDPDLIDVVGENRVASILAHEYGHLQPGRSISYGFIRRAMISVNFLRAELLTEDETTIFRRTVRIVTAIFPPVLKEGSRGVSHHLGRLFYRFYAVWIKLLTSAYRDEFHDAEFSADAFAYSAFGQEFPTALMEVAILQYVNKSRQLELNDEKILENWPIAYRSVSASHPSLEERIQRLGAEELANAGRQRELTLKYLRLGGATPPIVQASIPLLQSLCFDEFPNPEKIKTPCSYPD
nr:M48 family metalloprotease [Bradyrhizobium tropiciagri]